MLKHFVVIVIALALCWPMSAVEERHGILVGEVLKLDREAKTVAVNAADGTEHTFHFLKRTIVQDGPVAATDATDVFHGLKEGSEVAVYYTAKGTEETAQEIDNIGKEGLKATDVTVAHIDRGAKLLAVKTADGAHETYRLTESAAGDAGKDIGEAEKSVKITVYYTEDAGQRVARFFKRAF